MDEFMNAVTAGDFVAVKQAFNSEMSMRTRSAIEATRRDIAANSCPFEADADETE